MALHVDDHGKLNPLLDPSRRPSGLVEILCTEHGRFVAWCSPPPPPCEVACGRVCQEVATDAG